MRITLLKVPNLILVLLPFVIGYNGHGVFGTILWMILWAAFRQAVILHNNLTVRYKDKRWILETLPISHYVEKVRWCMDKAKIPYEEEKDIGLFWILTTGRLVPTLHIPGLNISISNSSDILKYLYSHLKCLDEEKAKFLEPSPKSLELEQKIDKMGAQVRRYIYYHALIANKNPDELALKVWGIHEASIPPWQKSILKVTLPILKKSLIALLKIDKENVDGDLKKFEEFFNETDKILSKNQFLLGTEEPTYIDYSFAALAALVVIPDQYGGPRLTLDSRLKFSDFTMETQKYFKKFRNTPSGKFVLKMYAEYR